VASVNTATATQPKTISGRRPIRSPNGAIVAPPMPSPTRIAEKTQPNEVGGRASAALSRGTASAIAAMS
jgi:hypothetical protein